jgi:4-oxalocrotonate tautomerase
MPKVTIQMFEGRTLEQKRALVKGVTDVVCQTCNAPPERVSIIIQEMNRENYSSAGVLACDEKK